MREIINTPEQKLTETVYAVLSGITDEEFAAAMQLSKMDMIAGLQVGPLEKSPENFEGLSYKYAAAKIIPLTSEGKRPCIKPHYHEKGYDFVVFRKETEVALGRLGSNKKLVNWDNPYVAKPSEKLRLDPGTTHTWRATEGGESDFVFCCPGEHLIDNSTDYPEGDRYLTESLENGTPIHYLEK